MSKYKKIFKNIELKKHIRGTSEKYLEVAEIAEKLIKDVYHEEELSFPIDVIEIAHYLGINVVKDYLNENGTRQFSRILGRIISRAGKTFIIVDGSVSYKTQRYTIANAIGRYLLSEEEAIFESNYAIPLIPQSLEEIAADVVALFLLLPMSAFKKEFASYLEQCEDYPLDVDAWMQYLSDVSQTTMFNLAIGYQQLKQVLCYQRQNDFKINNYDIKKMKEDPYDIIFA